MNIMVIIFLFVNFIFLFLGFIIVIFDIMKAISKKPSGEESKSPRGEIGINKRGYLFGILSLLSMVFLSLNYIG